MGGENEIRLLTQEIQMNYHDRKPETCFDYSEVGRKEPWMLADGRETCDPRINKARAGERPVMRIKPESRTLSVGHVETIHWAGS